MRKYQEDVRREILELKNMSYRFLLAKLFYILAMMYHDLYGQELDELVYRKETVFDESN